MLILKSVWNMYQGRRIVRRFLRKNKVQPDQMLVIMNSKDKEIDYYGAQYMYLFLKETNSSSAYILATRPEVRELDFGIANINKIELLPEKKIENIIKYLCICMPNVRNVVLDIDTLPNRKKMRGVIGKYGVNIEYIVARGIYHLKLNPVKNSI